MRLHVLSKLGVSFLWAAAAADVAFGSLSSFNPSKHNALGGLRDRSSIGRGNGLGGLRSSARHGVSTGARSLATVFSQCASPDLQAGIFPDEIDLGCISMSDFIDGADDVFTAGADDETGQIVSDVFEPVQIALNTAKDVVGLDFGACVGDFEGTDIVDPEDDLAVELCSELPLKADAEWSIIAFAVAIPEGQSASVCPGIVDGIELSACLAISTCDDLPSIAFAVNGGMLACIVALAGPGTGGIASLVGAALDAGLDSVAAGYSLTNAFEIEIPLYNGFDLLTYTNTPTMFDIITVGIDPERFGLGEWFELSGMLTRGHTVVAPSGAQLTQADIESALAEFNATGESSDILVAFEDLTVQALFKGELSGALLIEEIPVVGQILPNLEVDIAELNGFLSTGEQEINVVGKDGLTTEIVYPGVSLFVGSAFVGGFIESLVNLLVDSIGAILDLLPSWVPIDIGADLIKDSLDLDSIDDGSGLGAGVTFNTARTGFLFDVPLLITGFGQLRINCFTDYNKFDCEVKAIVGDLLEEILTFITGAAEEVTDGTMWVIRKTDELFSEGGEVIGVAFEGAADEVAKVFTRRNLEETARKVQAGVLEVAEELEAAVAIMSVVLDPFGSVASDVEDAVREVAEYGAFLFEKAEEEFRDAENAFKSAARALENAFSCRKDSILNGGPCRGFNKMQEELEEFGHDIEKALDEIFQEVGEFFDDVAAVFFSTKTSYKYEDVSGEVDGIFKCPLQRVIKTTKKKVLGITTGTKRRTVAKVPKESCICARLEETDDLDIKRKTSDWEEVSVQYSRESFSDSVLGANFAADKNTLNCSSQWLRSVEDQLPAIPLEVTCEADKILKNGTFTTFSVKSMRYLNVSDQLNAVNLVNETRDALVKEITATMYVKPLFCVFQAAPPGDGRDTDCNTLIDDDILCNYEDGLKDSPGTLSLGSADRLYFKDCKCAPPFLGSVDPVELSCDADRSAAVVGRPPVTLSGTEGCPVGGNFIAIMDTPSSILNPFENCGEGTLIRTHQYIDDFGQLSNNVTQTIKLKAPFPVMNKTLIDPVRFVKCTDPILEAPDGVPEYLFFLAPDDEIPDDLGSSQCSSDLSESFEDLSIDYRGCPEFPVDPSRNAYKGWNVQRRWFVEDECFRGDEVMQVVVREDETAPTFDSFPRVRVQSCRASFEPFTTGFPVVSDDCDPADVINPSDWRFEPEESGRISFNDVGDTSGCQRDFVREFVAKDRVCNQVSATHSIHSCPFDFQPPARGSSTEYDPSSQLPIFNYKVGGDSTQSFADEVHFFEWNGDDNVLTEICNATSAAYLGTKLTLANWTTIPDELANGVFKFDDALPFAIEISDERLPFYETVMTESDGVGVFRVMLSCSTELDGDQIDMMGCIMFKLTLDSVGVPSVSPSALPSAEPSETRSERPSAQPSEIPSLSPSTSSSPSAMPNEFVVRTVMPVGGGDPNGDQSCAFSFRASLAGSTTIYDPVSNLPLLEYVIGGSPIQTFADEVIFNEWDDTSFGFTRRTVDFCNGTTVEYLDTIGFEPTWTAVPEEFSNGVFKFDDGSPFSIQINDTQLPYYETILRGVGAFRIALSCTREGANWKMVLDSCVDFQMTLGMKSEQPSEMPSEASSVQPSLISETTLSSESPSETPGIETNKLSSEEPSATPSGASEEPSGGSSEPPTVPVTTFDKTEVQVKISGSGEGSRSSTLDESDKERESSDKTIHTFLLGNE